MISIDVLLGETILDIYSIIPRGECIEVDFNANSKRYVLRYEEVDFEAANFILFEEHSDRVIEVTDEAIKIEQDHFEILFSEIKRTSIYEKFLSVNQ